MERIDRLLAEKNSLSSLSSSSASPAHGKNTGEIGLSSVQLEGIFKTLMGRIKKLMSEKENEGRTGKEFKQKIRRIEVKEGEYQGMDYEYNEDDGGFMSSSVFSPEVFVEYDISLLNRTLTPNEEKGNNIMFTLRTVQRNHKTRLPLLFDTWISKVNKSNIFIMTDGIDPDLQRQAKKDGMHYILSACTSHASTTNREDMLCCRTGIEFEQIFKKGNENYDWLCHVDDDMYVRVPPLVQLLSGKFNPRTDAVYFGRSGSEWFSPRLVRKEAILGEKGISYHFAVGGMFCLSRAMLELARQYIVGGNTLSRTCNQTMEPDDVTVGFVVGVLLNKTLSRTEKIYTHGLHLISTVDPYTLSEQIAFSYGFGSTPWGDSDYNAIDVPDALYSFEEDESQFRSLHCHLYPSKEQCMERLNNYINGQLSELLYN